MPLLFCLGVREALRRVAAELQDGEELAAYLDDVYATCSPERVVPVFELLKDALWEVSGIRLNLGETKVWNSSGCEPEGLDTIGEDVWSPEGTVVLGSPLGSEAFIQSKLDERMVKLRSLLGEIEAMTDPQEAWQLLVRCAVPRFNHTIRNVAPSLVRAHAEEVDAALWGSAVAILNAQQACPEAMRKGRTIAQLPCRLGGLGLRSALRTSPAAHWASWADAGRAAHDAGP